LHSQHSPFRTQTKSVRLSLSGRLSLRRQIMNSIWPRSRKEREKNRRGAERREGKRRVDKFSTENSDVSDTYAKYNMSGECSFFTRAHNLAIFLYTRLPEQAASCEKRQVLNIINRRTLHHLAFCSKRASEQAWAARHKYLLSSRACTRLNF
jgi:hypothetical protein